MEQPFQNNITGGPAQVIVVLKEGAGKILERTQSFQQVGRATAEASMQTVLGEASVELVPLFADTETQVAGMAAKAEAKAQKPTMLHHMTSFYTLKAANYTQSAEHLAQNLRDLEMVESAYVKPIGEPPMFYEGEHFAGKQHDQGSSLPITNSLTGNQTYLTPAPNGIDAQFAWTIPGGRGNGVNIIDLEGGWNFSHEDLAINSGGLLSGFNHTTDPRWYQHGTAVLGEIGGDTNSFGVTGIAPNSNLRAISVFTNSSLNYNSAAAIRAAADALRPGDILLLEQHRPGPNYPGGNTQMGFIAIEWWPDDFTAIQYATSKGVIVVEAAGNGSENLDAAIYNTPATGFPSWWRNPYRRTGAMDCGAIIVGAGAPPPGTNGGNWGPARSRLGFSNFGSCVDCQGWGNGVTTTGYGDVTGTDASNQREWYTHFFSGTSSASPIVTGAIASLQGIQRAAGRPVITPSRMRQLLRTTGSAQQASAAAPAAQRIGNQPNMRQLVQQVTSAGSWCGTQFTGQIPPLQTIKWFTHSWPDMWQVLWTVVPTAPVIDGNAQIEYKIQADRQAFGLIKYFIEVRNLTNQAVTVEARFCVLAS